MAVTKTVLKNHRQSYQVHIIATAAGDSSTVALTDLVRSDETTSGTLQAQIAYILCGVQTSTTTTVNRGSSTVLYLNENHTNLDFSGVAFTLGSSSSVVVQFGGAGWIILDLHKKAGYVEPNTNVGG
jgi:hypothetical protein